MNRRERTQVGNDRRGFALVISLTLMSLVLLTVVLLSTQVRVALASSGSERQKMHSRQAALLGLAVAVGRLQSEAGPDRRATAPRSLIEPTTEFPHWVGVWDLENETGDPYWLVSNPSESEAPSGDDIAVIISEDQVGDPDDAVMVAYEDFVDGQKDLYRAGYWVSEENTKAALDGAFVTGEPQGDYGDGRNQVIQEMETAFLTAGFNPSSTIQSMRGGRGFSFPGSLPPVGRASSISDYSFGLGVPPNFAEEHFHNFTTRSYSVLSNPLEGGLKKDLSYLKTLGDRGNITSPQLRAILGVDKTYVTNDWIDFVRFHQEASTSAALNPNFNLAAASDDQVRFVTHPMMPELAIACGIGCRSTVGGVTGDVYVYFYIFADFSNPFPFEMSLDNGRGSWPGDPTDFDIRVTNLPEVEIVNLTEGITTNLQVPDIEGGVNTFYDHEPGYMRPISHPSGSYRSEISGNTSVGVVVARLGNLGYEPDTWDEFEVRFPRVSSDGPPVTIEVRIGSDAGYTGSGSLVKEIRLPNWGGFQISYPATSNGNRFVRGGTAMDRSHLSSGDFTWGFHVRYVDDWIESISESSLQNLDYFFSEFDPRNRVVEVDMLDRFAGDGEFVDVAEPDDLQRSNFMRGDDFFQGAWFGNDSNNRDLRIFDLPFYEPVSVGQLNEMVFDGRGRKPIGGFFDGEPKGRLSDVNGDGDAFDAGESLSNLYDQFFFSTIPSDETDWEDVVSDLANHRLKVYDTASQVDITSLDTGENLLVEWGFNVNSVSPEAWTALLESTILEEVVVSSANRPFRFSPFAGYTGEGGFFSSRSFMPTGSFESSDYVNENETGDWVRNLRLDGNHPAFVQGFRQMDANLMRDLAEEIVRESEEYVQQKGVGSPIISITEFADSGILERAILAVPGLNEDTEGNGRIPYGSLGRIDQELLLRKLGPSLVARSDTFRVHVVGEYANRQTNERASQRVMAELQRVPGEIEDLGRKFRMVSFQWIEEDES